MTAPAPDLMGKLKEVLAKTMRETNPQKYDELASELWRVLEEIEKYRVSRQEKIG